MNVLYIVQSNFQSIDIKGCAINRALITRASERFTKTVYCFTPSTLTTNRLHVNSKPLPDPRYAGGMLAQQADRYNIQHPVHAKIQLQVLSIE